MCDTLVSLTDHGVLFAKNSDRGANESQVLTSVPAADHAPGDTVACTWISIPQAAHTHAVLLSRPWWLWGAEMGTNEHGVTIGNEAVFTKGGYGEPALLGMDLLRLALERAATAEEAVSVLVDLLETHGQGGPCSHDDPGFTYDNSFLVADPNGAIVLETAGREWATETVTGRGRSISNGLTIPDFAKAHANRLRGRLAACSIRRARTQASADRATDVADLFAALRDHGPTPSPVYSQVNGALAGPCAHAAGRFKGTQTTASWVADLRDDVRHWATATAAPCTSIFKPIAIGTALPAEAEPTDSFDPGVGWWRHELLHRLCLRDHGASVARFAEARDALEARWLADPPSTAEAFAQAEHLEAIWAADLRTADLPDRRPRWLRSVWTGLNDAAGIDPGAARPRSGPEAA